MASFGERRGWWSSVALVLTAGTRPRARRRCCCVSSRSRLITSQLPPCRRWSLGQASVRRTRHRSRANSLSRSTGCAAPEHALAAATTHRDGAAEAEGTMVLLEEEPRKDPWEKIR